MESDAFHYYKQSNEMHQCLWWMMDGTREHHKRRKHRCCKEDLALLSKTHVGAPFWNGTYIRVPRTCPKSFHIRNLFIFINKWVERNRLISHVMFFFGMGHKATPHCQSSDTTLTSGRQASRLLDRQSERSPHGPAPCSSILLLTRRSDDSARIGLPPLVSESHSVLQKNKHGAHWAQVLQLSYSFQ